MPKRHHVEMSPPRARTQSRRAASKEALKQMQLLLDDEDDAVEIPDDDIIPVAPSPPPPPPPKKKYKLSHRKSSDGNDRDVIVLKSITNRNAENTLELDCWVEQLEEVQQNRIKKMQDEEKELQAKLDSLVSQGNAKIIHKGDLNTIIEVTEQVQSAIAGAKAPPTNLVLNNVSSGQQSYQLVMDPRLGLIVGAVTPTTPPVTTPQAKVYQGKVQVAQNLQQTPTTSANQSLGGRGVRTRRGAAAKATPPPSPVPIQSPQTRSLATNQTRAGANPTKSVAVANQTRSVPAIQTRSVPAIQTRSVPANQTKPSPANQTKSAPANQASYQTRSVVTPPQTRSILQTRSIVQTKATPPAKATPPPKAGPPPKATPAPKATPPPAKSILTAKKSTVSTPQPIVSSVATRQRGQPTPNSFSNIRPSETNVEGGLSTGTAGPSKKVVVDLTSEENKGGGVLPDSKEISFNKLQGKTYPSLVVVARPHLRVQDLSVDRPKLDAKVKSVLMHAPTKFTEWLIQQGLVRSEQKCTVHSTTPLKLGMYSDVSKFPYSGGYVWISECCPQRFVSVFSGSLFEGSPHPPMVILKLLYHWACQTNIQNVTQWVKVDNLYVKGMFTWLRSLCTVALQTHIRQLGGPGIKVEVGVISLGTTSQDGNQRQVKVEVLGVLETTSKLIRLRAVEPQVEGDRNYKKRFSKILEPIHQWVHPQSILIADLTVDKQTLVSMGFTNVVQSSANEFGSNKQIMEYLRRIVPRMFQNTLSLLSRQIIQQFLDELVWREWFGTSALQAFDNLIIHMSEQTRHDNNQSLIVRLNKVAQNPFKNWSIPLGNATKVVENPSITNKKQRARKPDPPPKVTQNVAVDINRPPKSVSPDVPEQMVPLENYYYGTIDTYSKTPSIVLNMKCPYCKSMFDNNIQLMNHLFKHAHNVSQDAQLCRYCLTSVTTANDLLKHISTSHPAETKFDNGFVCLICETQYMNPFVLGKHMSKEHCPSELPYQCGTCGYRCSNHKQAIDHFYKTHDNGPTIQCPFCLKSTTVFSSSRNIVQNMNYFIQHLQKHQRKQFARRCGKCNLWFVQKDVLKEHQTRTHVSQRGKQGLVPWNAPRNGVMVPKSRMDKYPGDGDVINFGTMHFNLAKSLMCKECSTPMDTPKHFPSFESCQNPNCQYSTCCTNAMQEHNAKCSKSHNPIAEDKLPFEMFCICGYSDTDGNQLARHLAICERKSAYPSRVDAKAATVTHSMLDVLGLVRKPEEAAKVVSTSKRKSEAPTKEEEPVEVVKRPVKALEGPKSAKRRKVEITPESKTIEEEQVVEAPKSKKLKKDKSVEVDTVDMKISSKGKREATNKMKDNDVLSDKSDEKSDDSVVLINESDAGSINKKTLSKTVEENQPDAVEVKESKDAEVEERETVEDEEPESIGDETPATVGEETPKTVGEEKSKVGEEGSEAVEAEEPKALAAEIPMDKLESENVEAQPKDVQEETETVEEESNSIEEESKSTEEESKSIEEESKIIEEKPKSFEEEPKSIEEEPKSIEEESESVEKEPESVEKEPESIEEEPENIEEEPENIEDEPEINEDESNALKQEPEGIEKEPKPIEGKNPLEVGEGPKTIEQEPTTIEEKSKDFEEEQEAVEEEALRGIGNEDSETNEAVENVEDIEVKDQVAEESRSVSDDESSIADEAPELETAEEPESVESKEPIVEEEEKQDFANEEAAGLGENEETEVDHEDERRAVFGKLEDSEAGFNASTEVEDQPEAVQNHVSDTSEAAEPEITTDDIQGLLSDVVGKKLNTDANLDVQSDIEPASTETDIGGMSNGELQADQVEQIDEAAMDVRERSTEVTESEVSPMETD